jgi:hypothetical protein
MKWSYQLTSNDIHYGYIIDEAEDEEVETVEVVKKEFRLSPIDILAKNN